MWQVKRNNEHQQPRDYGESYQIRLNVFIVSSQTTCITGARKSQDQESCQFLSWFMNPPDTRIEDSRSTSNGDITREILCFAITSSEENRSFASPSGVGRLATINRTKPHGMRGSPLPVDRPSSGMITLQDGSAHLPRRPLLRSGLIPVELYSAIEDHNIRFHLLHKKCGSRVRNQLFCPVCKVVIERDETVRGYEVTKGQYVRVEDAELEALEAEANSSIDMREFIPIEKVDPIYFESSYYLAPDKGADKPYRLLAETMAKTGRVALAQTVFHNKESLVLIRSFGLGVEVSA